jgi:hypothetical protein
LSRSGQDQYRNVGHLSETFHHLPPVHDRHRDIEENQVRPVAVEPAQTVHSVRCDDRIVASPLQAGGYNGPDVFVVLNNEDFFC